VKGARSTSKTVQPLFADDVADADQVDVVRGYFDRQITLGDAKLEVQLLFALDDPLLDFRYGRGPVMGVDDGLSDLELHESGSVLRHPG
jgi:hypothetical protein